MAGVNQQELKGGYGWSESTRTQRRLWLELIKKNSKVVMAGVNQQELKGGYGWS